jgi:hypothetical protein
MRPGRAQFSSTLSHMHTPSLPARRRLPGRRSTLTLLLAALLVALAGSSVAARSLLLGISTDENGRNQTLYTKHVTHMNEQHPSLWSIWSQWGAPSTRAFPTDMVGFLPPSVIPVIWWEPTDPRGDNWTAGKWERFRHIVDGKRDKYIRDWARAAKATDRRIIVRFAHEVNGNWFPWGIGRFDNTPKNFKAAWQRIWRLFKEEGALAGFGSGKVELLWSVTKQRCPNCNPFSKVYPGDKYVHWVGITAFNWGTTKSWKSMEQILASPIKDLQAITKKKIIVAELASHFKGGDKAQWIRQGYRRAHERWPRIKAVLYLDAVTPKQIWGHPDWRLVKPNDGSALAAYKALTADPRFQGSLPRP